MTKRKLVAKKTRRIPVQVLDVFGGRAPRIVVAVDGEKAAVLNAFTGRVTKVAIATLQTEFARYSERRANALIHETVREFPALAIKHGLAEKVQ